MFEPPAELGQTFQRDMSITLEEFGRGLRDAFAAGVSGGPQQFRVDMDGACLEISLQAGPPRRIAALSLPTAQVKLCFTAGEAPQRQALLQRMDRAMQRGGG